MATTTYGSYTSNRKTSGKNVRLQRHSGGAKKASKVGGRTPRVSQGKVKRTP